MKKYLTAVLFALTVTAPAALAADFEFCPDEEFINHLNDEGLAQDIGSFARGNQGSGRLKKLCIWAEGEELKLGVDATVRHRHKTRGIVVYDTTETLSAVATMLDCQVTNVDASSSGFITDLVLRNRAVIGRIAQAFGQSVDTSLIPPASKKFAELCQ